jgi:transcription antitermination factor NusG
MRIDTSGWKVGTFVGYVELTRRVSIDIEGRQLQWLIVITEPGRERRAVESIEELGLQTYWPRLHRRTPGGRRRSREIEVSMFPGRVLVQMPLTDHAWREVRFARGVIDFMHQADSLKPAILPEPVVDEIRKVEAKKDAKYRNLLMRAEKNPYCTGRDVWVEILPLRKELAKIVDLDGQGRINVLLQVEILGRQVWPVKPHLLQFADDDPPAPKPPKKKVRESGSDQVSAAL